VLSHATSAPSVTPGLATHKLKCVGWLNGHGKKDICGVVSSTGFVATVGELDRVIVWRPAGKGMCAALAVGARVEARDLVERPDLNGQRGVVLSSDASKGRCGVRFDGCGEGCSLKPCNLRVVTNEGAHGEAGEESEEDEDDEDPNVRAENFLDRYFDGRLH